MNSNLENKDKFGAFAFFDLDGTVTTRDTLIDFLIFSFEGWRVVAGFLILLPVIFLYKLKVIPNWKAKEIVFTYFFRDYSVNSFKRLCQNYAMNKLSGIIKKNALDRIYWHISKGHQVAIVSASIKDWIAPWCVTIGIDIIATEIEIKDGKLTGKFSTENCYGIEKVNRIHDKYGTLYNAMVYAYGNSKGDEEMLQTADKPFYKPF